MIGLLDVLFGAGLGAVADASRARLLKHPLRQRILDLVEQNPGILPQAVGAKLGHNRSTVRYHLAVLQAAGIVRIVSQQQRAHLFAASLSAVSQSALAVLQRGRTWELARQVAQSPGQPQRELTAKLQMSRKILRKYVDRLLQVGLIQEVRDPPFLTYFPTVGLHKMVDTYLPEGKPAFPAARLVGNEAPRANLGEDAQAMAPEIEVPR